MYTTYPRNMVLFQYVIVITLHKGDKECQFIIIIIIIIIIIRMSHFSALAGKYSPTLGCSNQQD